MTVGNVGIIVAKVGGVILGLAFAVIGIDIVNDALKGRLTIPKGPTGHG